MVEQRFKLRASSLYQNAILVSIQFTLNQVYMEYFTLIIFFCHQEPGAIYTITFAVLQMGQLGVRDIK